MAIHSNVKKNPTQPYSTKSNSTHPKIIFQLLEHYLQNATSVIPFQQSDLNLTHKLLTTISTPYANVFHFEILSQSPHLWLAVLWFHQRGLGIRSMPERQGRPMHAWSGYNRSPKSILNPVIKPATFVKNLTRYLLSYMVIFTVIYCEIRVLTQMIDFQTSVAYLP